MCGGLLFCLGSHGLSDVEKIADFSTFFKQVNCSNLTMAPKNRFVSEYKANFKQHKVHQELQRQQKIQQHDRVFTSPTSEQENPDIKAKAKIADGLKRSEKSVQKENLALRYKAGLAPSMSMQNKIRYLSEYQKQFEWKRPVDREAPILSAEKMIYGGQDGNPSRATKINLPKKTEYQLQFVKHPLIKSPEIKSKELDYDKVLYSPVGYQDEQAAAGKPSKKSPPPIIQRKSMVFQSEYHANFKSPSKYDYVKGSWVGADPPQFHPPDEQSDSGNQTSSSSWYQQVLELREKVYSYRSRAREGSHFLTLLKDLQKLEKETRNESKQVDAEDSANPPVQAKSPPSEPSRKSTPVNTNQSEQQEKLLKTTENRMNQRENKESDPLTTQVPTNHEAPAEDKLFWDKKHTLPGPSLNKTHSLDNISNESTMTNDSKRSSADELPPPDRKRQAWPEYKPVNHQQVIPPYYTSGSSNGDQDDSRSDVTISEMENTIDDNQEPTHNEKRVHATRKLFSGRRENFEHDRKDVGYDRKGNGDDSEVVGDDRKLTSEIPSKEKPTKGTRKLFTGKRQDLSEERKDIPYNRGNFGVDRQLIVENRDYSGNDCITSSFTSDDEGSCHSHASSVLSVEAMNKRRALASETLQRAKRRQAQL